MCPNLYFYVFMYVPQFIILHLYACAYVFDQDLHHDLILKIKLLAVRVLLLLLVDF